MSEITRYIKKQNIKIETFKGKYQITIVVEEKYIEFDPSEFERMFLSDYLVEIRLGSKKMNTMRELILSGGCEGFITNRTFTKKEKISNDRLNVLIYCSCGAYLHKNKKNRFVFGHTNECNKKLELKSVNFLFKIAEGLELNEEKIKKNVFYCPKEKK